MATTNTTSKTNAPSAMLRIGLTLCFAVLDVLEWGNANTSTSPQVTLVTRAPAKKPVRSRFGRSSVSMTVTPVSSVGFSAAVSAKTKT